MSHHCRHGPSSASRGPETCRTTDALSSGASCVCWQQPGHSLDRSPNFLISAIWQRMKMQKGFLGLFCVPFVVLAPPLSCQAHHTTLDGLALLSSLLSYLGSPRVGGTRGKMISWGPVKETMQLLKIMLHQIPKRRKKTKRVSQTKVVLAGPHLRGSQLCYCFRIHEATTDPASLQKKKS